MNTTKNSIDHTFLSTSELMKWLWPTSKIKYWNINRQVKGKPIFNNEQIYKKLLNYNNFDNAL